MANGWQALRRGESVQDRRVQLERAHERFVADPALLGDSEMLARFVEAADVRPVVFESWLRSQRRTIDPDRVPDRRVLDVNELQELRATHPIGRVLPVVQRLLLDEAADSGFIVAVGDAAGRLLWVDGNHDLRFQAESMGFIAGTDWSEQSVGTSAPGAALELDHAIQVLGAEHYNRAVHRWSCTAAPVHDPTTGAIIGVIDVTGGDSAASPHTLPLIEATLAAVEAELKLESLRSAIERARPARQRRASRTVSGARAGDGPATVPRLIVLGRDPALLEYGPQSLPLSGRHAEILLALAAYPTGLSAAALAEQVYGTIEAEPNLRPEMVRLRRWLARHFPSIELGSRPYRLGLPVRVDATEMLAALGRGAHRLALAAYEGPVLPASRAPVADVLRLDVDATLREAMLQSAAADPLYEYAQNWAEEDEEVWGTLLRLLPPLSPKRARVVARLEALRRSTAVD